MISLRRCSLREPSHLVHVDAVSRPAARYRAPALNHLPDMFSVDAVGQVAARGEVEAQERVARLQQGQEHRRVGRRAGMRLHVGEACSRTAA